MNSSLSSDSGISIVREIRRDMDAVGLEGLIGGSASSSDCRRRCAGRENALPPLPTPIQKTPPKLGR